MGINKEPQIGQQTSLNFESPEETKQKLVNSIREARRTGRKFTDEESKFIEEEMNDLDDNPYQDNKNKRFNH